MSCLSVNKNSIAVSKGLHVDYYDNSEHIVIEVSSTSQEPDSIIDLQLSTNDKHLALITSTSKQLLIYELPQKNTFKAYTLPRSGSKIRFTANNEQILVADKSGDVLLYDIKDDRSGTKLLGHLSLLVDVLQTDDEKYIITSDRDEKIRVTSYPNTYNIHTYCLGHKEFVNHIEILPHNKSYLVSCSGDGHLNCWYYSEGRLCYSINTNLDLCDDEIKLNFIKAMDSDGIEVNSLPIVHLGVSLLDESSSLLAVAVHNYNCLLLYKIDGQDGKFNHKLVQKLQIDKFPSSMQCGNSSIYVYNMSENSVSIFKICHDSNGIRVEPSTVVKMFDNLTADIKENNYEAIKVLYKRKFDNVQEYQERKRQRLEKSEKII